MQVLQQHEIEQLIPNGVKSLCIMAAYETTPALCSNLVEYMKNLNPHFECRLLLTNSRGPSGDIPPTNIPDGWKFRIVPNQCLDFGMWYRVLHTMCQYDIERLCLVNNSCFIVEDLTACFLKAKRNDYKFWGMTTSYETAPHIQSYFVVADGQRAVATMLQFFHVKDMDHCLDKNYTRINLINEFEISMSLYMTRHGLTPIGMYTQELVDVVSSRKLSNISYWCWDMLLFMKCPLLKKKRHPFPKSVSCDWIDPYFKRTIADLRTPSATIDVNTYLNT